MTLLELTGHEAGIIVYKNGDVIVANWGQCDDDCIPVLAPVGDMVCHRTGMVINIHLRMV